MSDAPAVSILMPAYNGGKYIRASIECVLAQTLRDFELIIVDDFSTDNTGDIVANYSDARIRYFRNPANLGEVGARNRAFSLARGRYVAVLDCDDLCVPTRLELQADYLDTHPNIVLVGSEIRVIRSTGELAPYRSPTRHINDPLLVRWRLHFHNFICHSSIMFRANAARKLETYVREECRYAPDYDFYLRLLAVGEIARLSGELTVYRQHAESITATRPDAQRRDAIKALATRLSIWLGQDATDAATLMLKLLQGEKVAGTAAELETFGNYLDRVLTHFRVAVRLGSEERARVTADAADIWWDVNSRAVRGGRRDALDVYQRRPLLARATLTQIAVCRASGFPLIRRARELTRRGLEAIGTTMRRWSSLGAPPLAQILHDRQRGRSGQGPY